MDISNGEGIGISLFVQGCPFRCKGCFNPSTWDFSGGMEWTAHTREKFLELAHADYVRRISILGGEPLCQPNIEDVEDLLKDVKKTYPNKKIWVYTGYRYESICDLSSTILNYIDVIVDGQFEQLKADINYPWAGSTNQRVIDVQRSLRFGKIILYKS